MTRALHLGCGGHRLPPPWENYDREVDITRELPFPSQSARFIHAEHVIEHVPFVDGWAFLLECHRVLEFGGALRLAFPDVTRFEEFGNEVYLEFLKRIDWPAKTRGDITRFILCGSEHQSAWTEQLGRLALEAAGFRHVVGCRYGASARKQLNGIDGHHFTATLDVARLETTVLEGTK